MANPSAAEVTLSLSLPTRPRLEYVLTSPGGNLSSHSPVLNGNVAQPLQLAADGSLPPMPPAYCGSGSTGEVGGGGSERVWGKGGTGVGDVGGAGGGGGGGIGGGDDGGEACSDGITLPPRSWAFFVLLGAHAEAACGGSW